MPKVTVIQFTRQIVNSNIPIIQHGCESFDGEVLNTAEILAARKDCSLLPTASRESKVNKPNRKHQEEPLSKAGVVGAFN